MESSIEIGMEHEVAADVVVSVGCFVVAVAGDVAGVVGAFHPFSLMRLANHLAESLAVLGRAGLLKST